MKCPKCGYLRKSGDQMLTPPTECPSCGIVYSKVGLNGQAEADDCTDALIRKPSPVHEDSLKTARERVEMRLRKYSGSRGQDDKRTTTLQLAKQFATEGVRRRREEWQRRRPNADSESDGLPPASGPTPWMPAQGPAETPSGPASPPVSAVAAQDPEQNDLLPEIAPAPDEQAVGNMLEEAPAHAAEPAAGATATFDIDALETDAAADQDESEESPFACPSALTGPAAPSPGRRSEKSISTRLLPMAAWLILMSGMAGAVLSWTTLERVHADTAGVVPAAGADLPMGLLLGFAYLSTGVLGFAFFWMAAIFQRQLSDIRHLLNVNL